MDKMPLAPVVMSMIALLALMWVNLKIWRRSRNRFVQRLGVVGAHFPILFCILPLICALAWLVSVSPPFSNPGFYETQVAYFSYGRDFTFYPTAALYIGLCVSLPVWLYAIIELLRAPRVTYSRSERGLRRTLKEACGRLTTLHLLGFFLFNLSMAALFFQGKGWDSLYISRAGRFEGEAVNFISYYTSAIQVIFFLSALVSCGLLLGPGATMLKVLNWSVAVVPLVVAQSRMLGVSAVALIAVLWWRISNPLVKWLSALPLLYVAYIMYILPLYLRSNDVVGLYFLGTSLSYVIENRSELFSIPEIAPIIANLGLLLPNISEVFESALLGTVGEDQSRYYLLMLSPLPGVVDGFTDEFLRYGKFHNPYTPYNVLAELAVVSLFLPVVAFLGVFAMYLGIFTIPLRSSWNKVICDIFCCGSVFILSILASQYNPRLCVKVIYLTLITKVAIWIWDAVSNSPLRMNRSHMRKTDGTLTPAK
jgi:hypothetical protein